MSRLPFAGQPDIVLASQKDQIHTRELRDSMYSVAEGILGPQTTSGAKPEINLLADFFYYFLTLAKGRQTLGEEYCDIYYFNHDGKRRLSILQRRFLALALVFAPYFLARAQAGGWNSLISSLRRETARERAAAIARRNQQRVNSTPISVSFASLANYVLSAISLFSRLHLAMFYWWGDYLDPIKRLFRGRYVFTREPLTPRPTYRVLSIFILVQLSVQTGFLVLEWLEKSSTSQTTGAERNGAMIVPSLSSEEAEGLSVRFSSLFTNPCGICLYPLKSPACPPCGHVYCYECIVESCIAKSECPLCRREATPQSVQCIYI